LQGLSECIQIDGPLTHERGLLLERRGSALGLNLSLSLRLSLGLGRLHTKDIHK
jgi:hypothetical protein